ncbi:MAG: hypothetical protein CMJ89_09095 [Planctomycetes bacterium]|jgi:ABC-type Zn uptake system ZnuABC Zn-binding protein ZnuA|nr:hypothetical protein [Planctomycetota bacterium]
MRIHMLTNALIALAAFAPLVRDASVDRIMVVATIPDLADIAREVGGDKVEVKSIAKGRENLHSVRTRPSDLVALSRAEVFLEMGLSMEHAWVPRLLLAARNKRIELGKPGFVNVSEGWNPILMQGQQSRRDGADLHPRGNPHYNLDPAGGRHMADRILEALVAVDPSSEAYYEARHAAYVERLDAAEARWKNIEEKLAGNKVVTYHRDFTYLNQACGIEEVATLEPKPGVPPTARHIASVVKTMREQDVRVIITAAWSNSRQARKAAKDSGALLLELPAMVGGTKESTSWIAMMDHLHDSLAAAFGVRIENE